MSNNNYDNQGQGQGQGNFADTAAGDAGYETGRVEGDARQGADRAGAAVTQGFEGTVQGVKDAPSDLAGAVEGAAKWVGDQFGSAEREGRDARNDADRFGAGVGGAYEQGQAQGQGRQ